MASFLNFRLGDSLVTVRRRLCFVRARGKLNHSNKKGRAATVNLSQSAPKKHGVVKRRHDQLFEHFTRAHRQLVDEVSGQYLNLGVGLSKLGSDGSFDVDYASVMLKVRFRCETPNDGPSRGRVSFFERTMIAAEPERYLDSLTFNLSGVTNCTVEGFGGDVHLYAWPLEMVLSAVESVLRARASEYNPA